MHNYLCIYTLVSFYTVIQCKGMLYSCKWWCSVTYKIIGEFTAPKSTVLKWYTCRSECGSNGFASQKKRVKSLSCSWRLICQNAFVTSVDTPKSWVQKHRRMEQRLLRKSGHFDKQSLREGCTFGLATATMKYHSDRCSCRIFLHTVTWNVMNCSCGWYIGYIYPFNEVSTNLILDDSIIKL